MSNVRGEEKVITLKNRRAGQGRKALQSQLSVFSSAAASRTACARRCSVGFGRRIPVVVRER
jgi:hypothetical protein